MNICLLSREYPPETHFGGIGTYTNNMALALSRLGHRVHVITSTGDGDRTYREGGVWVHRISHRKTRPKELWHLRYAYAVAEKVSGLGCPFDIVQSSEFASEALWLSIRRKVPLVTRLATPFFMVERLGGKGPLSRRPLINWMERTQVLRSDGIFTSTRALAGVVAGEWGIDPSRIDIIPNSIDVSRVIALGRSGPVPPMLKGRDFLLYFGRLEERKGVHILAQALPEVFSRFPHIRMVFVGSDLGFRGRPMREYVMRQVDRFRKNVIFLDNLPQRELFPIVGLAKLVVLPSLWEAFGFVCVEAMALGRPVIATSGSGFGEIIEDKVSGYLVRPGDREALARKIISCLGGEEDLGGISRGAERRAWDFEVSKIAERLLNYYRHIIARRDKTAGWARTASPSGGGSSGADSTFDISARTICRTPSMTFTPGSGGTR